jgi:hypothetical protein
MLLKRIAIYHAEGIAGLPQPRIELFTRTGDRVTLAAGSHLSEERRCVAEMSFFAERVLHGFDPSAFQGDTGLDEFRRQVERIESDLDLKADGVYWIVEVWSEVPEDQHKANCRIGTAGYRFSDGDNQDLLARERAVFEITSAAWASVANESWTSSTRSIAATFVALDNEGGRIYPLTLTVRAEARVLGSPTVETLEAASRAIEQLFGQRAELESVCRLLTESGRSGIPRLQAFIAAWTGLEIFVNKTFPRFEKTFMADLRAKGTSHAVLSRIGDVMQDKYRLSDKFALILANLTDDGAEDDVEKFKSVQKQRNEYFHSMRVDASNLPLADATMLLRKYLNRYISQVSSETTGMATAGSRS